MLCFGHFCEIHGPTSILCTQSIPSKVFKNELPNINSNNNNSNACQSCQLMLPKNPDTNKSPTYLRTVKNNNYYISTKYPSSQNRFLAVRQACLHSLSSEHLFNDSTPMMYSDSKIGTAIILVFNVEDNSSRGHIRKYCIICLGENEIKLAYSWDTIVPQLKELAKSIKLRASKVNNNDQEYLNNERFLRIRDVKQTTKSLTTILKDDKIFIEIHSKFTKILNLLEKS